MGELGRGNFFEDFKVGQLIEHATPRTITHGDTALYTALYGSRFAVQSSSVFAKNLGYEQSPVDDLLVFHIVFGKTVPDISLNAMANLGYAEVQFRKAVYPGDTLSSSSEIIGLKENSNRQTGVVYVRTTGANAQGDVVLDYVRWVMVRKRDVQAQAPDTMVPILKEAMPVRELGNAVPLFNTAAYDCKKAGSPKTWGDYTIGERIDHLDGMTLEEAEHQLATRLYQNTAKVHFNQHVEGQGRLGRRLVYGGHIISLARALTFNGLQNAFHIAAINGGRHVAPSVAGDTIYAWSEVLDKASLNRDDIGALRIRLVALKDKPANEFSYKIGSDYDPAVLLDLDMWVVLPVSRT